MTKMHLAIVQTWGLGDLTMTTPVIAEYKRIFPESRLTLIVQGKAQAALMLGSPMVDRIVEMPPRSNWSAYPKFFWNLRRDHIDAAFLGTRIDAWWLPWVLRFLAGIKILIGDGRKSRWLYRVHGTVDPTVHRVDRMLQTFSLWTGHPPASPPTFPLPTGPGLAEANRALKELGIRRGHFIVIHPGSSVTAGIDKRVPAAVARRVADSITGLRPDLSVIFLFGPDEIDYIAQFEELGARQVVLRGLSLAGTVSLISQCAGFIGSDSGLGHLAAASGISTQTVVGPTLATETAPYGTRSRVVKRVEALACQPCWGTPLYGNCPFDVRCMTELPERELIELAAVWPAREL
ncbi:heptosyltransferase-2 [Mycolicibacterium neoaurum]|uniref:glycosyltransferase family 9 protein n=1 Tax=Mycolicibacterium neoaurum TaxID=1795 RepID=UPI000890D626|nr:glycosyltransferase family 9 protein [Mycolicibacterium neoaurum]SDC99053.1 heptosyltransferase-2 [Mycolicibacterium neoaurum]